LRGGGGGARKGHTALPAPPSAALALAAADGPWRGGDRNGPSPDNRGEGSVSGVDARTPIRFQPGPGPARRTHAPRPSPPHRIPSTWPGHGVAAPMPTAVPRPRGRAAAEAAPLRQPPADPRTPDRDPRPLMRSTAGVLPRPSVLKPSSLLLPPYEPRSPLPGGPRARRVPRRPAAWSPGVCLPLSATVTKGCCREIGQRPKL